MGTDTLICRRGRRCDGQECLGFALCTLHFSLCTQLEHANCHSRTTTVPLTPAWRLFASPAADVAVAMAVPNAELRLIHAGLLASCDRIFRPFRLQPPFVAPGVLVWFSSEADRASPLSRGTPLQRADHSVIWTSPFASRLATTTGRDHRSGGARFVLLRTGHSPPVALHPVSRRRSDVWLQSLNPTLTRTSTSLIQSTCKRTSTRRSRRGHCV